ncbi:Crp/Fnr family transcriptional regulator [Aliarcobacter butzleri]|uniref:Crp/Fnr family transcriptional regulator n=2 Tax=Aliarcobacter butzleri TaxID=28197 RepID=UPI003AF2DD73
MKKVKNIQKTSFGKQDFMVQWLLYLQIPIVQALEDSIVVDIQHDKYREILAKYDDLKMYHILYLEKHWIMQKDDNGYSLVLEDAKQRYERFKKEFGHIISRLSQYQIASYLGISPTHLSRIRKES